VENRLIGFQLPAEARGLL